MNIYEKVRETAMQSGMWQADFIDTQDLLFYPEIREICEGNTCRNYGAPGPARLQSVRWMNVRKE